LIEASKMYNSPEEGYQAIFRLLKLQQRPTAVFTASDEVAIGVLSGLGESKISVPQEIALASVDDIELSKYIYPALTTVRVPQTGMGIHAVRTLINNATQISEHPISQLLPTELIVRQSCGASLIKSTQ
jgi:DNA-binding LacI/PurR family transcriptional regulator